MVGGGPGRVRSPFLGVDFVVLNMVMKLIVQLPKCSKLLDNDLQLSKAHMQVSFVLTAGTTQHTHTYTKGMQHRHCSTTFTPPSFPSLPMPAKSLFIHCVCVCCKVPMMCIPSVSISLFLYFSLTRLFFVAVFVEDELIFLCSSFVLLVQWQCTGASKIAWQSSMLKFLVMVKKNQIDSKNIGFFPTIGLQLMK